MIYFHTLHLRCVKALHGHFGDDFDVAIFYQYEVFGLKLSLNR